MKFARAAVLASLAAYAVASPLVLSNITLTISESGSSTSFDPSIPTDTSDYEIPESTTTSASGFHIYGLSNLYSAISSLIHHNATSTGTDLPLPTPTETDTDMETDSESDSDLDTETDTEEETDTDTDSEFDFDSEYDSELESDLLSDTDETDSILPTA
ncbi:hypothetical protein SCHPADRAFT_546470 [Schizopora paradoxa]|uniref:Uncharacterized protein n=1 Tax=Schizopora paradoxa TaxID=27342 RepID=A0A0H2RYT7_9AGAM|nr:hypothetical protein SCHPADRAFT_546470 [Schizopora paradoxa]